MKIGYQFFLPPAGRLYSEGRRKLAMAYFNCAGNSPGSPPAESGSKTRLEKVRGPGASVGTTVATGGIVGMMGMGAPVPGGRVGIITGAGVPVAGS